MSQAVVNTQRNFDPKSLYPKFKNAQKGAKEGTVVTRFPPEPSGYMHMGHCKAAFLNYHYSKIYNGKMILRFDDTNPTKEKQEYIDSIKEDLIKLGIFADEFTHTSDHFELIADKCKWMIEKGKAYSDNTGVDQMRKERWDGIASANRENSVEENLRAWGEMQKGSEEGKTYCVRAKLSIDNNNKCLRDPVMYRCNEIPHPRTGTKWKCYPTYDFCCPLVDSHEGVTWALRTNEYADRIAQYQWFLKALELPKNNIYEFSRLNFVNTTLSKRKLTYFVEKGLVDGWTDPRFPTVSGILRRGMLIQTLAEFMMEQGPSKSTVLMEWDKIWALNRKNIDGIAGKFTAIEKSKTCLLTLTDLEDKLVATTHAVHPKNTSLGEKPVFHNNRLWLESDDVTLLEEGQKVTLMRLGNININKITKLENGLFDIQASTQFDDKDFKSTVKLTWLVAQPELLVLFL